MLKISVYLSLSPPTSSTTFSSLQKRQESGQDSPLRSEAAPGGSRRLLSLPSHRPNDLSIYLIRSSNDLPLASCFSLKLSSALKLSSSTLSKKKEKKTIVANRSFFSTFSHSLLALSRRFFLEIDSLVSFKPRPSSLELAVHFCSYIKEMTSKVCILLVFLGERRLWISY